MEISFANGVRKFVFNRIAKKNAITIDMYQNITKILNSDAFDNNVIATIFTGKGDYFSSGNDFHSSLKQTDVDPLEVVKNMINALINYPKLLVSVVNGPAIGIAATFITLCDIIYCSDRASFEIPFIRLGFSMEGCSSFVFPRLLGRSKASEMLFLNHILTAKEALCLGFVAEIVPNENLEKFVNGLSKLGALPLNTVIRNKKLLMRWSKNTLLECNEVEKEMLSESIQSDDFVNALSLFMGRKSKL